MPREETTTIHARLDEISESVKRTERAIVGDPQYGVRGLADICKTHEARIGELERWRFWLTGAVAATPVTWAVIEAIRQMKG